MRICETCGTKVYGGKHREVALPGRRAILCPECGRIEFAVEEGDRIQASLQAIARPSRARRRGRDITFHTDRPLKKGERLQDASFSRLPGKQTGLPKDFHVYSVRPLVVSETVEAPAAGEEGKKARPRRRRRTAGYAIRAFSG